MKRQNVLSVAVVCAAVAGQAVAGQIVPPATEERMVEQVTLAPHRSHWGPQQGYRPAGIRAWECTVQGALVPGSVEVTTADGKKLAEKTDFVIDPKWGSIWLVGAAVDTVTEPVTLAYRRYLRRIDSLVEKDGKTTLRTGLPDVHLCRPPTPEPGEKVLTNYYVTAKGVEAYPILEPAAKAPRTSPDAAKWTPRTLAKLQNGEKVKILAWGDSVTEGLYLHKSERWQEQFLARLKRRFPKARIELVSNGWGGRTTSNFFAESSSSQYYYPRTVLGVKPDLVITEFVNDKSLSPEVLQKNYERILVDFNRIGAEWIILTPHYERADWMNLKSQRNCSDDPRPLTKWLRQFCNDNGVGLADASLRWGHLWKEGIPYETLLVNDINHPNFRAMSFFADALMDFFDTKREANTSRPRTPAFGRARPILPWGKVWNDPKLATTADFQLPATNCSFTCDLPQPFDLGRTAGRPSQRVKSNRDLGPFSITPVPCVMYTRAYVLCSDSGAANREPTFTIRLTRWNDTSEWDYQGRAHEAMSETRVDLRTAKKLKVGEIPNQSNTPTFKHSNISLWLVEVPLDLGDIQDIVKSEDRGNFMGRFKGHERYLDLEFLGLTKTRCAPLGDRTMDPDPRHVSSVTVYGARLEYPAADFSMRWSEPGNIFHNDEKPVTFCDVTVYRPGKYTLGWTITDAEGKTVKTGEKSVGADVLGRPQTNVIDLAQSTPGWYALTWRLSDAEGRTLMTHHASFALLGKDTRTSGFGEGPYGIGSAYSWHYRIPDKHYVDGAKLGYKLGVRHYDQPKYGGYKLTVDERRKWKLGTSLFSVLHNDYSPVFRGKKTEEKLAEEMRQRLKDDPNTVLCQLFWESHESMGYAQAPELTGGKYDPAKGYAGASNRVAFAKAATKFMRKYFPEIPITIGNTLACTELVAEFIRGGLPEANVDYMGLEVIGRDNLPERQWNSSLQSADLLRETARILGYKSWKPGSGVENNYRLSKVMGQDRQAWWYVRDQVLGQCWRFPSIHVGDMVDAGNQYTESMWGGSGITHRWPYLYPKKAYVGMATTTKVLDMVTDAQAIPTGDDCVYAVRFTRRDGKFAYGLWTSRAKADVRLTMNGAGWTACDIYGRPVGADVLGRPALTVGEAMTWIVAEKDLLAKVECVRQSTPNDVPPKDFKVAVKGDDATVWKLAAGPTTDVETGLGAGVPCRVRAKNASFKVVEDAELGKCLELDLGAPDLTLPKPVMEYMTLELKEPVAIAGDATSAGMRVKGNSGWGRLYWIVEGADGKRTVSTGLKEWKDEFDFNGRMTVCYGCWSFARYPLAETSSITDFSVYDVHDLWSTGCVKYPAKLVGIAYAAESRPLFLTERREKRQTIRIRDIGFFD